MDDDVILPGVAIIIFLLAVGVVGLIIVNPIVIVGAGERGVLLEWGAVQEVIYNEGFHWKIPIYQKVVKMDVKTQRMEGQASAASKDLQDVATTVVLNYHLDAAKTQRIYQTLRKDYEVRIIDPSIQEVVKAVTAQYNAEELITQRPLVKNDIRERLTEKLVSYHVVVEDISITNFQFSEAFSGAIEAKQVAEQNALRAERVIKEKEALAQQQIAVAEGDRQSRILRAQGEAEEILLHARARAEALRLQKQEITPELNKFKAIEKWDGTMPMYVGSGIVPFIELDTAQTTAAAEE